MDKRAKEHLGNSWTALFRTIRDLRLPWLWIALSLALNLTETTLMLKLPVTTSGLMSGNITGTALTEAIMYLCIDGCNRCCGSGCNDACSGLQRTAHT